jgi:hypothetical protein
MATPSSLPPFSISTSIRLTGTSYSPPLGGSSVRGSYAVSLWDPSKAGADLYLAPCMELHAGQVALRATEYSTFHGTSHSERSVDIQALRFAVRGGVTLGMRSLNGILNLETGFTLGPEGIFSVPEDQPAILRIGNRGELLKSHKKFVPGLRPSFLFWLGISFGLHPFSKSLEGMALRTGALFMVDFTGNSDVLHTGSESGGEIGIAYRFN